MTLPAYLSNTLLDKYGTVGVWCRSELSGDDDALFLMS